MKLTDFDVYRQLLLDQSGMEIIPDQTYLLESRLKPVAKKWGYPALSMMTMALNGVPEPGLVDDIVEAMINRDTAFFRDEKPFQSFKNDILPIFIKARKRKKTIRVWCAGCSSGQEPYSLAIMFKELQQEYPNWKFQILASDLSEDLLQQATEGRYTQFEVQRGMPVQMLMKHFEQDDDKWQLKDDVRSYVTFYRNNLLNADHKIDMFDVIFCRNVLGDFCPETRAKALSNITAHLEKDGFMFFGADEDFTHDAILPISSEKSIFGRADGPHIDKKALATGT